MYEEAVKATHVEGIYEIPLILPSSLDSDRTILARQVINAQFRLKSFAKGCAWEHHLKPSFADRVEIYDDKGAFDRRLRLQFDLDPQVIIQPTIAPA